MKEVLDYKGHTFKTITFINNGSEWHYYVCKYCKFQERVDLLEYKMEQKYADLFMEKFKCISDEEKLEMFWNNNE